MTKKIYKSRFIEDKSKEMGELDGLSAQYGRLKYMRKKPKSGEEPKRSKYQAGHFLKEIESTKIESAEIKATREVAAQEFLRLMIPAQPKARLVQGPREEIYVQSKEIPDPIKLTEHAAAIACGESYQGLGELDFFLNCVLTDYDQLTHNYLLGQDKRLYRIDFGMTLFINISSESLSHVSQLTDEYVTSNSTYREERNQALLKFLLLPPELIDTFSDVYFGTSEEKRNVNNSLKETQKYLREILQTKQSHNFFPDFDKYLTSKQGMAQHEAFKQQVLEFKTKGKKTLVSFCSSFSVDSIDKRYRDLLSDRDLTLDLAFVNEKHVLQLQINQIKTDTPLKLKLIDFLKTVETLRTQEGVKDEDLAKELDWTYKVLKQEKTPVQYLNHAKTLEKKQSRLYQRLGGIMIAIGLIMLAAGIALTATQVAIPLGIALAAAGTATAAVGLGAFFHKKKTQLETDMIEIATMLPKMPSKNK
ncbi:MAG: hypothetical protein ACOYKA_04990 [Legionellaceae bacterium]